MKDAWVEYKSWEKLSDDRAVGDPDYDGPAVWVRVRTALLEEVLNTVPAQSLNDLRTRLAWLEFWATAEVDHDPEDHRATLAALRGDVERMAARIPAAAADAPPADRPPFPPEPDGSGADGSRCIRNAGHAIKAIGRVRALMRHRYGDQKCPLEHAPDVYRVVAVLEDAAVAGSPTFVRDLGSWAAKRLRMDKAAMAKVHSELRAHSPVEITQRWLGEQLGLTDAERTAVKFWDAEAIDRADPEQARKARRAAQARARRERNGATPRAHCLARKLEQEPGTPRSSFYDQQARLRKPEISSPRGGVQ